MLDSKQHRAVAFSRFIVVMASLTLWAITPNYANAKNPTGQEIIQHIERLLWGKTSQGRYAMTITTPHWQRTLELQMWMESPQRTFIRILAPRKEKGIGSLRIKDEMWNYLPKVERTIKVPPSMMLQPWMGSDFTNDDLVKESNVINDYSHEILSVKNVDGVLTYVIQAVPKAEAAVVWGKLIYYIRKQDLMPLRQEYYSERGELIKVLSFSDVKEMDGRLLPTRWKMQTVRKPGNETLVKLKEVEFNRPIASNIFSLRNLRAR
ncbi:MAG: outer membrane lipoprotein-sorting protein [Gammaproteobacteria bacterium]|nr:MAG: outer membrane lipoprotein-sorting protein [Gammaproteobacteria bacterium]